MRFVPGGLDLDLLDEVERHPGTERAEHYRIGPERAVSGIRDVDAIDDVLVLQSAGTAYGRVRPASPAAAADSRREVERVPQRSLHGHPGEHLAVDVRSHGRTGYIHDRGAARHFNRFRDAAHFELERQLSTLSEPHLDAALFHRLEPREFRPDDVNPRRQERRKETPLFVGCESLCPLPCGD